MPDTTEAAGPVRIRRSERDPRFITVTPADLNVISQDEYTELRTVKPKRVYSNRVRHELPDQLP